MASSLCNTCSVLTAVGLVSCLGTFVHITSLLWLFLRPSRLHRYLHATDGNPAWALVTGASGGIGRQLAHELASCGFNVVLHGRTLSKLQRIESELVQAHPTRAFRTFVIDAAQAFSTAMGTSPSDDWAASLEDINLTVLVNNAGGSTERKFDTLDALSSDRLATDASVNALFPTLLIRQLIPLLHRNAPGLIINIGSLADLGPTRVGSYAASKAYLMKLSEMLGREMRQTGRDIEVLGIRVGNVWGTGQTVAPATDLFTPDASTMAKAILARVGCGRHTVVAYWAHVLLFECFKLLPDLLAERMLIDLTGGWDMADKSKYLVTYLIYYTKA
jgi:17beta-estradiol 17-dehydrogenase / very-long-chain 3-oxoacyl-CoA reductase